MASVPVDEVVTKLNHLIDNNAHDGDIYDIMKPIMDSDIRKKISELFLMAFYTRDIRGGKGKRRMHNLMWYILLSNPNTKGLAFNLLELIPEYGCWRDLFMLLVENETTDVDISKLKKVIYSIVLKQFIKDETAMLEGGTISYLAKWIPRENRMSTYARDLASLLFPTEKRLSSRMALYRKRVAALNRYLNTVEIRMCENNWDIIEPENVPNVALEKYKKAFLNVKVKNEDELRHPMDAERMSCRENFQGFFAKKNKGLNNVQKSEKESQELSNILRGKRYESVREKIIFYYYWFDSRTWLDSHSAAFALY